MLNGKKRLPSFLKLIVPYVGLAFALMWSISWFVQNRLPIVSMMFREELDVVRKNTREGITTVDLFLLCALGIALVSAFLTLLGAFRPTRSFQMSVQSALADLLAALGARKLRNNLPGFHSPSQSPSDKSRISTSLFLLLTTLYFLFCIWLIYREFSIRLQWNLFHAFYYSLIYSDIFLLCLVICTLLGVGFFLLSGPAARLLSKLHRHTSLAASLYFLGIFLFLTLLLVSIPGYFANRLLEFQPEPVHFVGAWLPPAQYMIDSAKIAFFASLALVVLSQEPARRPLWLLLFLPFKEGALLFWVLVHNSLSRLGSIWYKSLAAVILFSIPLIYFFSYQPIHRKYPVYDRQAYVAGKNLCGRSAYQAAYDSERENLYLNCGQSLVAYRRSSDHWAKNCSADFKFLWDYAAYDFRNSRAWVMDGEKKTIYRIDLEDCQQKDEWDLSGQLSLRNPFTRLYYDEQKDRLVLLDKTGGLFIILPDDPHRIFQLDCPVEENGGEVVAQFLNQENGRLFLLQKNYLSTADLEGGGFGSPVHLPSTGYGLAHNSETGELYISFPAASKIGVLDENTFEIHKTVPAPLGVRALAYDEKSGYLFAGSLSGMLEIRDVKQGMNLVSRTRLLPGIHWIEVMPEYDEILVTGTDVMPMLFNYRDRKQADTIGEKFLRLLEEEAGKLYPIFKKSSVMGDF